MIAHLVPLAVFARAVDEGSFRAAARRIGISPSRVSETVSALETFLGLTLLYRTTRKIALTNEGRTFHARVADMVRIAETGLNELNAPSLEQAGALSVSVPASYPLPRSRKPSPISPASTPRRHCPYPLRTIPSVSLRMGTM